MKLQCNTFIIVLMTAIQFKMYICTTPIGLFYILPDDSTNTNCPSQPCATLSHYLLNMSVMSNVKYLFLSGKHSLSSNITIRHAYNITMVGANHSSPTELFCHSIDAVIIFADCFNITITNLVLKNCGGTGPIIMPRYDSKHVYHDDDEFSNLYLPIAAAVYLHTCYYCNIKDVTFIGYGIIANNLLAVCYFDNLTIHLQATKHSFQFWCNQGIKLMNHGKNPYNHNLIYMSRINISANVNNCLAGGDAYHMGIRIDLEETNYDTTIVLYDSTFHHIYIRPIIQIGLLHGVFSRSTLWIKNCTFQFNNQLSNYETDEPAIKVLVFCSNMTLTFISCLFYKNHNLSPLLSIKEYFENASMNDELEVATDNYCCRSSSNIHIRSCSFLNNTGKLMNLHGIKFSECPIPFLFTGPFKIVNNQPHSYEDIISIHHTNVSIIGEAFFEDNLYARSILFFDHCMVTFHENISFIRNEDCYQIITLHSEFAYIKVMENARIKFHHNVVYYNIKITKEDYVTYPLCIFQYISSTAISNNVSHALCKDYSISFYDNGGIVGLPDQNEDFSNKVSINYYTFHCKWLPEAIFYDYHPADINKQIIQTDNENMYQHTRVCYCYMNNTYDCSLDVLGPVFPGQVLQVDLCVPHESDKDEIFTLYIDTHNKFLPNSACKVAHQSQLISTITSLSKTYNFTIVSNFTTECELFLTAQPDLYKIYDVFYVKLLPCPIGFKLQNGVCDCDPILSIITDECYIDYSTIRRPANYWIVAHTQTNNTKYLISDCPMDYCLPYSSSVNLLHPDLQCQFNRTGILCSQCPHPLSMVFASSRCMKCTNVHILITIIVIVAGIVLVVLLYVLNLTVTNGTINGIIFYANIVSINDSVFLVNDNVLKPLRVFISFTNLDLGIETCFYNGMDSYTKMWLQLFFPFYLIIIAVSIIIASRYSTRILRFTYTRSLPVLVTLFLLSYTGVLRVVLTVLFSYSTLTHLPSGHKQIVWSIDASVPLFGLKFTILFIICLVLFLILIPFNITLLFTRYFLRFRVINRFKPLLDAFQGSYKDKYYYWVAVHLSLRSLLFAFYAFPTKLKLIFSTMLLISLGFYTGYIRPNKNKMVNIQELLLLLNLTITYAVSYQDSIFFIVTNIMISLAFVQFGTIVMYHFLTYTCHCNITCMLKMTKEKLMSCNKRNLSSDSNDIALLNIPERTYNYTEYRDGLVSDDFQ